MVEDEGKKEDSFDFTPEGEALAYISLEQARVAAMRAARDDPGEYGRRFSGARMAFDVVEQEEGEDYYVVTMSFRPEGDFRGSPGQEQFFVEKEGRVAHRQVLALPKARRSPVLWGAVVFVAVITVAIAGVVFATGGTDRGAGDEETLAALPIPTATSFPTPTLEPPVSSAQAEAPTPLSPPAPVSMPTPLMRPTNTPVAQTPVPSPTDTPVAQAPTPAPAFMPTSVPDPTETPAAQTPTPVPTAAPEAPAAPAPAIWAELGRTNADGGLRQLDQAGDGLIQLFATTVGAV
ncbi:MAG: hypothetical protein CL694_02040 [Chloroflexi bacterium]|nr:hypothetical protein [Chloroflexota bacterium]